MGHPDRNPDPTPTAVRWSTSSVIENDPEWLNYRGWVERNILRGMLIERGQLVADGIVLGYEKGRVDGAEKLWPDGNLRPRTFAAALISREEETASFVAPLAAAFVLQWNDEGYYEHMLSAGTLESARKVADALNASEA